MSHTYINSVPEGARQWKDFITFYDNNGSEREKKALEALKNYVVYEDFNTTLKVKLINGGLQPCFKFRQTGSEEYERLTSFSRLCVQYLFTDKEVFEAFQKEIGGKQDKGDTERRKREEEERKKRQREERQRRQQEEEERYRKEKENEERKKKKQGGKILLFWFLLIVGFLVYKQIINKPKQPFSPPSKDIGTTIAKQSESIPNTIVGVWKGRYSSSGKVTLTINNDMTGVFEFTNAGRSGSYKVSVEYSNGSYNIIGKEWINHPSNFIFYDLNRGIVNNGIFSGADFKLERANIPSTPLYRQEDNTVTNSNRQNEDYTTRVESSLSNAINACENGNWDDAYKYYTEAASYPTGRSSSIKQTAAQKFLTKAKTIISNNNGECDDFSKRLLQYANNLYPSSEIRDLLNRCGDLTSSAISPGSGRFPQGTSRLLSPSDLSGLSKYDLKIMRNEIFARHGYIFTTNDMKNYFQNQSWYTPRYSNVTSMLTSIEQKNIALIKRYE